MFFGHGPGNVNGVVCFEVAMAFLLGMLVLILLAAPALLSKGPLRKKVIIGVILMLVIIVSVGIFNRVLGCQ
jgi:hypothetical protein